LKGGNHPNIGTYIVFVSFFFFINCDIISCRTKLLCQINQIAKRTLPSLYDFLQKYKRFNLDASDLNWFVYMYC